MQSRQLIEFFNVLVTSKLMLGLVKIEALGLKYSLALEKLLS